ncbi:Late embryogenesis abundant protein- group 6 [Striga hermonthica]|uniref:Late embryogenesis abundant protein- group 6 n=1 Tax=Striga hermonthica TaxID=68872 RepID=A0A9N7RII7_STRHE|nr:Late embryogenesis abundant protein- group 6 [Striga hermonthica]
MEKEKEKNKEKGEGINISEGLPTETSPYTQYKDLEDYKEQGYGTHGHLETKPGHGAAASTDAPTTAGADAINRKGMPALPYRPMSVSAVICKARRRRRPKSPAGHAVEIQSPEND